MSSNRLVLGRKIQVRLGGRALFPGGARDLEEAQGIPRVTTHKDIALRLNPSSFAISLNGSRVASALNT